MRDVLGHGAAMETLPTSHSAFLVVMACVVALVSGFTGLSLTRKMADKTLFEKKLSIALASIALGGGIWAMHFIAMLGLRLPVLVYYDAAITLISALIAILIVGVALILLHFMERSPTVITFAGAILGVGILAMHYIGMAGLELCQAIYTPSGVIGASVVALGLCVMAIWVAYGQRSDRTILIGTVCFAVAVTAAHFLAMAGTRFREVPGASEFGPAMSNETLALGVIVFSFVIFGGCLWVGVTYLMPSESAAPAEAATPAPAPAPSPEKPVPAALQIPCERDGGKVFVAPADVVFVRADGHYSQVYTTSQRLFCAWPVTEASKRLSPLGFLQTHRSYLVNPAHVSRFERDKDKGRCVFRGDGLPPAPVSRSKLLIVQDALAAQVGAIRAS